MFITTRECKAAMGTHELVSTLLWLAVAFRISAEDSVSDQGAINVRPCKVPFDQREGICVNLQDNVIRCPTLRQILLNKNFTELHSAVCGEPKLDHLNETSVCCAVDEYIELFPSIKNSHDAHEQFKLIPGVVDSDCGKAFSSTTDRIIGGSDVATGQHPWMGRLGMELPGDDQIRFLCSGSIINERYILTAAHCFKHGKLRYVRLAETDEGVEEECIQVGVNETICQKVEDYEPETIIIHSNYTSKIGSTNDIALIRLKQPIRNISSPFTRPVCLPFIEEFQLPDLENVAMSSTGAKKLFSVQGWGKENNEENVGTTQLKQVYVPLRSNVYCQHVFSKNNLSITNEQICAGGMKNKGSCAGDSGSPLLLYGQPNEKRVGMRMFQIGIVSYGRDLCGLENAPVVYTRVRPFLRWILDNVSD